MVSPKALAPLLSLLLLACGPGRQARPLEQDVTVKIGSPPAVLLDQAYPTPEGNAARQERMIQLFRDVGCTRAEQRPGEGSEPPRVVCTLPGETDSTILVSANLEEPSSRKIADNWLGAAMLPSLYLALNVVPRHHTYAFVAFADESFGRGRPSAGIRLLRDMPDAEREVVAALVSLKGLHTHVPAVWEVVADPELRADLHSVSRSMKLPIRPIDFRVRERPVIEGGGVIRQIGPVETAVRPPRSEVPSILIGLADLEIGEYLDSFRLVSAYLSYLDQTLVLRRQMLEADTAEGPVPVPVPEPPG